MSCRRHQRRPAHDLAAAKAAFNTATVTVGGLYLTTHSVVVTLIGTTASTMLTCWAMWLSYNRNRTLDDREQVAIAQAHEGGNPLRTLGRSAAPQPSSRPPEVLVT